MRHDSRVYGPRSSLQNRFAEGNEPGQILLDVRQSQAGAQPVPKRGLPLPELRLRAATEAELPFARAHETPEVFVEVEAEVSVRQPHPLHQCAETISVT